ncbi:MAG: Flp pilus assembly complex ATPase component TadA, partial [Solobacterium sp.]|nr:Flp pilus assembly complex ATPase component TadA [Solobacterium sp.]
MEELLMYYLRIALQYHVTDIHFSLKDEEQLKVEMRVGGIIRELKDQKADIRFFRYLLYRSNMDVSRMMYPQTGRFETEVDGTKISLRFALVSSYRIASGVLRILNNHDPLSIDELSASPETALWMKSILNTRSGMFLFSGPT